MKNYDTKQALKIIIQAAKEYDDALNNKDFLIIFQHHGKIFQHKIGFHDVNFLHLTGIKTKLSALAFYNACITRKLSLHDIAIDPKGKVQQKLHVLPYLSQLLYNNCMIGTFINSGIFVQADYFVGNTRAVISVGFRHATDFDIPVTLYQEDIRKLSKPTCKVLAIFSKPNKAIKFDKCTYYPRGKTSTNFRPI